MNLVKRITGEGRAESLGSWGSGFDRKGIGGGVKGVNPVSRKMCHWLRDTRESDSPFRAVMNGRSC